MLIRILAKTKLKIEKPLIYSTKDTLPIGKVVEIPLGLKKTTGIIVDNIKDENIDINFAIKNIIEDKKNEYIDLNLLELKIIKHIITYYNASISNVISPFITKKTREIDTNNTILKKITIPNSKLPMNKAQTDAVNTISNGIDTEYILFGITGSGKTQVYIKLIEQQINEGKQVLILLPDIAITSQFYIRLKDFFDEEIISIIHSKITKRNKTVENNLIRSGRKKIVIGARSALFSRFHNLGLIIIDEFHDNSYKQDQDPRYNAINLAKFIAKEQKIKLLLGSATPKIDIYYKMLKEGHTIVRLDKRISEYKFRNDIHTKIVDLNDEKRGSKKVVVSRTLEKSIEKALNNKKKIILYINRRGYSNLYVCNNCGHIEKCPRCDIPLTVHQNDHATFLNCHHCDYKKYINTENPICDTCKKGKLKFYGIGTQLVKEEINELFKERTLNIEILDKDSTSGSSDQHLEIYNKLSDENINIIIGTQLITTGWDFYNVGLIGIILADIEFVFPDYNSVEKAYQTIIQVIGRGGRENNSSEIVIQTMDIKNKILQFALNNNFDKFFDEEIDIRKKLNYPPFSNLIKITVKGKNEKTVFTRAKKIYFDINNSNMVGIKIYPPIEAIPYKINYVYRLNIIIKVNKNIRNLKTFLRNRYKQNKDLSIDIDPSVLL
ncbi:MAG: replication restart helicase PriA [Patescibacteria group bacterium]